LARWATGTKPRQIDQLACRTAEDPVSRSASHHAWLLLANGVDVVAVSPLLGHSSPIVTLSVYSHAIPKERAGLTDRLANLFW
jgi:site-specific recombinase XerD